MKALVTLLLSLYAVGVYADKLDCITKFVNVRTDQPTTAKHCGAVSLDRAFDDGIKYRKQPAMCDKIDVEFFSIRQSDQAKFTTYCDEINSKNCYMIGIRENDSHLGIGNLAAHVVFPSMSSIPPIFSVKAHGIGHSNDRIKVQLGRIVELTLSCRKSR